MKQFLLVLKIAALLAIIFAAGVWVGRNTLPAEEMKAGIVPPPAAAEDGKTQDRWAFAFRRYARALELTPEQQDRLEPLFKETDDQLAGLPHLSMERQRNIEKLHERMEPHLDPRQKAEAERILKQSIQLMEKARAGQ